MKLTEKNYLERDVSWMYFNRRILDEAMRSDVPLMERLTMLGIYSNNLDEFFRVRVATLTRIVELSEKPDKELRKRTEETLHTIHKLNERYNAIYASAVKMVEDELAKNGIRILKENELDDAQQAFVRQYCLSTLAGNISPIWLDGLKSLATSADDTIYLAIRLKKTEEGKKKTTKKYALLELPTKKFGRFVKLEVSRDADSSEQPVSQCIMYLDDVLRCALPYLLPRY